MNSRVIPDILQQHAEEAAFLWILRRAAVSAPHYRLKDLIKLDNRVEAHLDGLRIGGEDGWRFCLDGLRFGDPGEVFAAAVLALESRDQTRLDPVLQTARSAERSISGLISAFGWVAPGKLAGIVKGLLNSGSSFDRRVGIAACAVHRVDPGSVLTSAVGDEDQPIELRCRALRAAGELRRRDLLHSIRAYLSHDDRTVRFWAAWSSAMLGDRGDSLDCLKALVLAGGTERFDALQVLLRSMAPNEAKDWLRGLAQYPDRRREVIFGVGVLGDPYYLPWLIQQMSSAEISRIAGESFSLITGVDIAYDDLDGDKPEGFSSGPTELPEDDNVAMDEDEDLPWPDPGKITAWWERNGRSLTPGIRHLCGQPISQTQATAVLTDGYQRQRCAAALELANIDRDSPLFETRAPGWDQRHRLTPH